MLKLPGTLYLGEWNQQVMQMGLGDNSTPSSGERRVFCQNGAYNIFVFNGSEWKFANNPVMGVKHPFIWGSKQAVSASGATITFPEALLSIPTACATAYGGPQYVRISSITTTQVVIYLYNSAGSLVSGFVYLIVIGERNVS